jgi:hypothetical protein
MNSSFAPQASIEDLLQKLDGLAARDARAAAQRSQRIRLVGSVVIAAVVTASLTVAGLAGAGLIG